MKATISAIWTPYKLLEELYQYFNDFAQKAIRKENECWLEINDNPIPWYSYFINRNMPLTTILDLYTDETTQVPYQIVMHFRYILISRNPPQDFLRLENTGHLKQQIKSGLKAVGFVQLRPD